MSSRAKRSEGERSRAENLKATSTDGKHGLVGYVAVSTSLGMTRLLVVFCISAVLNGGLAQEPANAPTASPTRTVRISFVPPPLEGTISLGIYDENNQLVRVLHQEAAFNEFTVGADALITKWDGKDDFGDDLSPGNYHARGFLVAEMKIEETPARENETPAPVSSLKVRLMANPLEKNERPTLEIVADADDDDVLLETSDGLPLLTITRTPDIKQVSLVSRENNAAIVTVEAGSRTRRFVVSGLNRMMAFDCGELALK